MTRRILVAGSSNMDLVGRIPRLPSEGETVLSAEKYRFVPGGKSANSAVTAARLGAEVLFCSRLGADDYGIALRRAYREEGIDVRYVKHDKSTQTGLALILVEPNGANRICSFPGANLLLGADDVEEAMTAYPDALLMQFEISHSVIVSATRMAEQNGIPVVLDAGPADKAFPLSSLSSVEIFSPNETETFAYTGIRPTNLENCLRASMALRTKVDAKYIVLKLGDRGSYIYDGKYCEFVSPVEVSAVDTTGAGDAFTAAMTLEYLRSGSISKACRFANIVGAYTVTREGAYPSFPTEKELGQFMEEKGISNAIA